MANLGTLQFWATFGAFVGMIFGYCIRPWVENLMAPLYTKFVGDGPDGFWIERKVNNKDIKTAEFQPHKDGPIVGINKDTVRTHQRNGMRVVYYNKETGASNRPQNRIVGLVDGMQAAVIQKGRTVERILNYLGIPWPLVIAGALGIVLIIAMAFGAVGYFWATKGV